MSLEKNADINASFGEGIDIPLHLAFGSADGKLEVIELLFGRGVDINSRNWYGKTPLIWLSVWQKATNYWVAARKRS